MGPIHFIAALRVTLDGEIVGQAAELLASEELGNDQLPRRGGANMGT